VNAFTGPPDHERHERQWQYPIPSGVPVTSTSTAPQKQLPVYFMVLPSPYEQLRSDRFRFRHGNSIETRSR
jgi:hypothetical protein